MTRTTLILMMFAAQVVRIAEKSKEKYDKEISIVYKFLKLLSKNKITSYSFLKQR